MANNTSKKGKEEEQEEGSLENQDNANEDQEYSQERGDD